MLVNRYISSGPLGMTWVFAIVFPMKTQVETEIALSFDSWINFDMNYIQWGIPSTLLISQRALMSLKILQVSCDWNFLLAHFTYLVSSVTLLVSTPCKFRKFIQAVYSHKTWFCMAVLLNILVFRVWGYHSLFIGIFVCINFPLSSISHLKSHFSSSFYLSCCILLCYHFSDSNQTCLALYLFSSGSISWTKTFELCKR